MTGLVGKATRRATQTATVRLMVMPLVNGEPVNAPELLEVPVNQPRGGGFAMTAPIAAGDYVDVNFDDVDTSGFRDSGSASAPGTARLNSLSDATATLGRQPSGAALSAYDAANMFMGTIDGANGLRISPEGKVAIDGAGEELLTILSELLDVLSDDSADTTRDSATARPLNGQPAYAALKGRLDAMKLR